MSDIEVTVHLTDEYERALNNAAQWRIIGIVIGLIWLGLAWGLWTGKGWAWIVTVIIAIISIIFNLFGAVTGHVEQIISLFIAAVMRYYLTRPNVKSYFGRGTKILK